MFISTLAFSIANILVKEVSHIPAMEVVFFRCAVASAFCFIGLRRDKADWKGSNNLILFLRGCLRNDSVIFLLYHAPKHSARVGDDHSIPVAYYLRAS